MSEQISPCFGCVKINDDKNDPDCEYCGMRVLCVLEADGYYDHQADALWYAIYRMMGGKHKKLAEV